MSATLKDVAKLAGVSTATVSYVLNNGPRPVRPETRERVLAAVARLGYQPRRKRKGPPATKSLTIGGIVPNANAIFFGDALEGIESVLDARCHTCLVGRRRSVPVIEKRLDRKLTKLVDGLIITPVSEACNHIERVSDLGIPTIIMDRQVGATKSTQFSGVGIDNYNITTQAVRLLFHAGHERIALINGPETIDTVRVRLDGYKDTLQALGLLYRPDYVFQAPFTAAAGREATLDLMSSANPPDAIICTSTDLAIGTLDSLNQLGLRLPDDIAFVCYGDTAWLSFLSPAITVIDAPAYLMGETSARLLLNALADPAKVETKEIRHIFLETKPILRDSHRRQRAVVGEPTRLKSPLEG